ncbi:hypothetical protein [Pantoea ananatis]|uniref:hypothetical protein n=1 Tax=Pantoea ananas TaxID=553 RepID=UPI002235FEC5|nr:hypothetical protein [Pantoea ananatis]BBL32413.1 hypothetical protein PAFU01_38610 [Pantoea ananatis]
MNNSVKCDLGVLVYLAQFPDLYFFIHYISNLEGELQAAVAKLPIFDNAFYYKERIDWRAYLVIRMISNASELGLIPDERKTYLDDLLMLCRKILNDKQWASAWRNGSNFAKTDLSEYKTYCETHPECGLLEWFYQSEDFFFIKYYLRHSGIPRVYLLYKFLT